MIHPPLESVLEKLCSGDPAAAERVFLEFEPYLRMVVRKKLPPRLRAKFDSLDIVQSVWADLLHGFREAGWRFPDEAHLRAFLVKLTRHRFIDRIRRHRTAMARERPLGDISQAEEPTSRLPSPSELVQADELGQRLLVLCAPAHREIVRLRLRGIPVAEIAGRVGLHVGSVHRILHDLACRVAVDRGTFAPASGGKTRSIGPGMRNPESGIPDPN
jgi:RNA polymerase sigma-70 factor (ECF subfamily)